MSPEIQFTITNVDYKRKDPVFWIEVQTKLIKYRQRQKRFPRYYSELEKLREQLNNTLDDALIPILPLYRIPRFDKEGRLVNREWWFSIRLPGETLTERETGTVENMIQTWFDRMCQHERVIMSESLREFVESEVGFRPNISRSIRLKAKQIIIHASESDMEPEFGRCSKLLGNFSNSLNQVSLKLDKLITEQNLMAKYWIDLSSSWVSYGGIERNPSLFILCKSMAKGYQQLYDLERSQASAANETLLDEINYEIKNCEPVQNAMQRRLNSLSDYLSSRKHTESSLRSLERLKSSINIDRDQANEAIAILEDARIIEKENLITFQRIDRNLRYDIEERYKPNTASDILRSIQEYAKSQLYLEKKKLLIFEDLVTSL